jgi:hypothetical protein
MTGGGCLFGEQLRRRRLGGKERSGPIGWLLFLIEEQTGPMDLL